MNRLARFARKGFHLFVEDGALATAAVAWLLIAEVMISRAGRTPWNGAILFAGLAVTLVIATVRRAGGRR